MSMRKRIPKEGPITESEYFDRLWILEDWWATLGQFSAEPDVPVILFDKEKIEKIAKEIDYKIVYDPEKLCDYTVDVPNSTNMRYNISQMKQLDDRILEELYEMQIANWEEIIDSRGIPSEMATVERLTVLRFLGLIKREPLERPFQITRKGKGYIEGRYDVATNEWLDEDGNPVREVPEEFTDDGEQAG